jgi:hypothetical protein
MMKKTSLFVAAVMTIATAAHAQPNVRDHRDHDTRDRMPPPPPPPPPSDQRDSDHHRGDGDHRDADRDRNGAGERDWRLEGIVVSNYWPTRGQPGTRVRIRGHNFPPGQSVMWGEVPIPSAKVSPDEITFVVPPGATTGMISLNKSGPDVPVGQFEVTAADNDAEWKRDDDDRRHRAEQVWAEREKQLSKDRNARDQEAQRYEQELESTREARRQQRLAQIQGKWDAAFLRDSRTIGEMTLHAQRLADIDRMRQVAEQVANGKLAVRIEVTRDRENQRHDQRMAALHAAFQPR